MLALLLLLQSGVPDPPTYDGWKKQLAVTLPRIEADPRVDGMLDEPVWRRAARLVGFSQYRPVDGRPAADSTEVLVWYAPDAIWFGVRGYQAHGHRTDWGYEVEVRIPFKSLRYQSADPQSWGLQVVRVVQHSGYEDTWTPVFRASASFLIQSGRLTGLTGLKRGVVVDLMPEFTSKVDG